MGVDMWNRIVLLMLLLMPCVGMAEKSVWYASGEVLVKFRSGAAAEYVHTGIKVSRIEALPTVGWQRVVLNADDDVDAALHYYRGRADVEYAEPNYIAYKAETYPDDPEIGVQWGLQNIKAPLAWDYTSGDKKIIVAVLDTGVAYEHPDIAENMWINPFETRNGLDDDGNGIVDDIFGVSYKGSLVTGDPRDDDTADWHGTHVAGIVGAVGNNGVGVSGVNWHVGLMAVKVLHGPEGSGTVADIIKGIDYAIDKRADVINLSLTVSGYSYALADALARADGAGVLTVSAAGNASRDNDSRAYSPAAIRTPNNIAVAAISAQDVLASYSNFGKLTVDLAAPGGAAGPGAGIYSTIGSADGGQGDYGYLAGTSMATPHVSGLAALLRSFYPDATHYQVKARILNGVRILPVLHDMVISGGVADAHAAIIAEDKASIFRVNPPSPYLGDPMVITGVNFGNVAGKVTVDEVELPAVESWSDTEIRLEASSDLPLVYGRLRVNNEGSSYFVRRSNRLPQVSIVPEPAVGRAPLDVVVTAVATDQDGHIVLYEWDAGGGVFTENTGEVPLLRYTFSDAGTYTVRVRVTDNDGGTAVASVSVQVEGTQEGGDSRCFVATAAWGSPMAHEVMILRSFRDIYLLNADAGTAFVSMYYAVSPPIADVIRDRGWLRNAIRYALRPVINLSAWLMGDTIAGSYVDPYSMSPDTDRVIPGEYLIGVVAGTKEQTIRAALLQEGGHLSSYYLNEAYAVAIFSRQRSVDEIAERMSQYGFVRYIEPNRVVHKRER